MNNILTKSVWRIGYIFLGGETDIMSFMERKPLYILNLVKNATIN